MYCRCMPTLANDFRVIALDTPGFGLSDPPATQPDIGYYARVLEAALEQLEVEHASVVGFRTGATIALELATRYPWRVRKLVLAAIVAPESPEERAAWTERLPKPWEPDGKGAFLEHVLPWLGNHVPEADGEAYLAELAGTLQAGPNAWWAPHAVLAYDTYARLQDLEKPTLFLTPCAGTLTEETKRAHSALPRSRYVEIPGGDAAPWEFPEEFSQAVVEFLKRR